MRRSWRLAGLSALAAVIGLAVIDPGLTFGQQSNQPTGANGASVFTAGQVSVGNTATLIFAGNPSIVASRVFCNQSTTAVYLGGATVTTSNSGVLIGGSGNPVCWDLTHFPGAVYGITVSSTTTVSYVQY